LVCPARIASAAASLMCAGVSKSGSPGPKSTTSCPSARSAIAACIAASVEEGCIRATFSAARKPVSVAVSAIRVSALSLWSGRAKTDGKRIHTRAQQPAEAPPRR
jgi:hypothetical protein